MKKSNTIESKYIINICGAKIAQTLIHLPRISKRLICFWHLTWQLMKNSNRKHLKMLENGTYFWQYLNWGLETQQGRCQLKNSIHCQPESSQFCKTIGPRHGSQYSWLMWLQYQFALKIVHYLSQLKLLQSTWPIGFFCYGFIKTRWTN